MPTTRDRRRRATVPWMEGILWAVAVVCFGYMLRLHVQAHAYQVEAMQLAPVTASGAPVAGTEKTPERADGDTVMGRLEIPDISLSVPILAGDETDSLRHGLFHIKGTAMPGGLGTVGLAGHRDTYFRPLRRISKQMGIELVDRTGTYHYAIDSTEIVTPDNVQVLDIQDQPELTLITCYPFDYIGAAPKRFIVHAHLLSVSPDAAVHTALR